jgi:lysophospholipase L1-like esterase
MADTFARMRQLIGTPAEWAANDIVIGNGEIAAERNGDLVRFKVGDGIKKFSELTYLGSVSAADLLNWADPAKGDAMIAVKRLAAGAIDRTQHDKNDDVLSVEDFLAPGNTPAQNSAKLNQLLADAIASGYRELYFKDSPAFDASVEAPLRSLVRFVGPGSLGNLYRKNMASPLAAPFIPTNDMVPAVHLKALGRTVAPVAVIMGDSISSDGPDTFARTASLWSILKERIASQNPDKAFTFYNRAIGGQTWLNANTVPTAFPTWYANHATPWLDVVQALAPDVLFLAFGMNDSNGFNAGALHSVVNKIKAWAKVPDIVIITNAVPALTARYPDGSGFGFVGQDFQEGRDYAAGWARTYAKQKGLGLIDLNRMMVAARDGYDVVGSIMRHITTTALNAYTATYAAKDFAFSGTVAAGAWAEGRVLKIKAGLGTTDFVFVTKTAGNFVFSGNTETLGTYKSIATAVPVPAAAFDFEVSVYGDIARLLVDPTNTGEGKQVIAEFQVIRFGGRHAPQIEWQDAAGTGPFTSISYISGYGDLSFKQIAADDDIWATSDLTADRKEPFGGNGVNHFSAKGIQLIVRPVVEAANLAAVRPQIDAVDLVLGAGTALVGVPFARAERIGRLVKLTGTISSSAAVGAGNVIFTVPAGFRPRTNVMRFGSQAGPLIQHTANGEFVCEVGPINVLYPLNNISYFVD